MSHASWVSEKNLAVVHWLPSQCWEGSQWQASPGIATNSPQRAARQLLSPAHKKRISWLLKPLIHIHGSEASYRKKIHLLQSNERILLPPQNATASQDVGIFIRPSHQKRHFLSKQNPSETPRVASSVFVLLKYAADVFLQRDPGQAET